jgi:hypothetical protein
MTTAQPSPSSRRPRRALELALGGLTLLVALALTGLVGAGLYRVGEWLLEDRSPPDRSTILFLAIAAALSSGLWPVAFRLLRGAGGNRGAKLLGPTGLRIAAVFFLLSSVLVTWIAFDAHVYWPLAIVLMGLGLMVLALRQAQTAETKRGVRDLSPDR